MGYTTSPPSPSRGYTTSPPSPSRGYATPPPSPSRGYATPHPSPRGGYTTSTVQNSRSSLLRKNVISTLTFYEFFNEYVHQMLRI